MLVEKMVYHVFKGLNGLAVGIERSEPTLRYFG